MQHGAEAQPLTGAADDVPGYSSGQGYFLLGLMILMTLCLELARLPLVVLVDPIRQSFAISDVEVSLLLGLLSSVPFVAMSLLGGFLSDRVSRRLLLTVAVGLWVAGALICATAQNFGVFATGRILIGIGAGMKLPIAMTWINDAFPPARRGRAIGAFFVVLGTGPSLAVILAGAVQGQAEAGTFGTLSVLLGGGETWRITLVLLVIPSAVTLLALPFLRDIRPAPSHTETAARSSVGAALGMMILVTLGAALMSLVDGANLAWVSTVLIREYGFDAPRAGVIFGTATLIAGLVGPFAGGALGDWMFGRAGQAGRVALAGMAALAVAPLVASYLFNSPNVLIVSLTLSGICTVTALSLSYVIVQAVLPPKARGFGTGVMSAATTLIGSTGPTLVALVSIRQHEAAGALTLAVALVAGVAATAASILFFICAAKIRGRQPSAASAV